ncbi:MAG: hypothetical protein ACP5QT_04130 [Brevinematia bacterium]
MVIEMGILKKLSIVIFLFLSVSQVALDDVLQAHQILKKTGEYEKKKMALSYFLKEKDRKRVTDLIIDLLTYTYDNPDFRENDQVAFYDDVIAEELIKILEKEKRPEAFPALLKVVLYSRRHRDQTVKAAWRAIEAIDWTKE